MLGFFLARGAMAQLAPESFVTTVEIEGVNYGDFGYISDPYEIANVKKRQEEKFIRIHLKRDFVTDPSLYKWANNAFSARTGLKDVVLISKTKSGRKVSQYVLKQSKPLSWSVEAADPLLGGFHESVELAVQKISVF